MSQKRDMGQPQRRPQGQSPFVHGGNVEAEASTCLVLNQLGHPP
jgi:hypothetical protein